MTTKKRVCVVWSKEELHILVENYEKPHGPRICKEILKERTLSAIHQKAVQIGLKGVYLTPPPERWEAALKCARLISEDDKKKRAIKAGKTMTGRPQRLDTVCGKTSNHKNGKMWSFKNDAIAAKLCGRNLNQLVRDNQHLFAKEDLRYDGHSYRASTCLRQLTVKATKKTRTKGSWKGWVVA